MVKLEGSARIRVGLSREARMGGWGGGGGERRGQGGGGGEEGNLHGQKCLVGELARERAG